MHTTSTKQNLILSLLELGSKKGIDNVSIAMLAKENGISKASVFHHFASRDEMVSSLFAYCRKLAYEMQITISFAGSASDVLFRAMDHYSDVYTTEPLSWFYSIIESEKLIHSEASSIASTLSEMFDAQSRVLIEELSETGRLEVEDLDLAIEMFSSTVQNLLSKILIGKEADLPWREERFINSFCALYKGH
ncbi:MAG TPA: TetR/AcrR family transcriptional regulator [Sphaerochaeta sp.]|nr:TetR/AcrR family transcriptional regulator [Sphaerochaeta sp.]